MAFDPFAGAPRGSALTAAKGLVGQDSENTTFQNILRFVSRPGYAFRSALAGDFEGALRNIGQFLVDAPTGGFINRDWNLLSIANTISSSRPGVRDDEIGHYVQRLTQIEAIAHEFEGVDKAFVLQAGRELRVLVSNTVLEDDELDDLAQNLAQRIQREVLYPGQIKISVLREFRSVELAH